MSGASVNEYDHAGHDETRFELGGGDNTIGVPATMDLGEDKLNEWRRALTTDLGPVVYNYLMDPRAGDIYCNANGYVLARIRGTKGFKVHPKRLSATDRRKMALSILGIQGIKDIPNRAVFNVELPFDGSRCAIVSPAAADGWELTIRKRTKDRITAKQMVDTGVMSMWLIEYLAQAMFDRKTIAVSGATGAGKTVILQMLLDILVRQIWPNQEEILERIVMIEHVSELWVEFPQAVKWRLDYGVAASELMTHALRSDPDRIISGEQRDATTLPYLRGITTGHPGLFTVHAKSAQHGPQRCVELIGEASTTMSTTAASRLVCEAVDIFVHVHRFQDGTRRANAVKLEGVSPDGTFKCINVGEKATATISARGSK